MNVGHQSIAEAFPELEFLSPPDEARQVMRGIFDPTSERSVYAAAAAFGALIDQPGNSVDLLVPLAAGVLDRLVEIAPIGSRAHDVLGLAVAVFAAEALQTRGEIAGTAVFLHRAMSVPCESGGWQARPERLTMWHPLEGVPKAFYLELATRYFTVLFGHAWRHTELDDLADAMWDKATPARDCCTDR